MAISDFRVQLDNLTNKTRSFHNTVLNLLRSCRDRLNGHILQKGNAHGMEPKDIGLGNVPDWQPSTLKQAQEGKNSTSFMSPRRVDNYAKENVFDAVEEVFNDAANRL